MSNIKKINFFLFFLDFLTRHEIHNLVSKQIQHKTTDKIKSSEVDRMIESCGDTGVDFEHLLVDLLQK